MTSATTVKPWMRYTLWLAAIYNVIFGAWVVLFPDHYFQWVGMATPNYPEIWQCVGMIVGVYGLGYFIAGFSPFVQWPIILVGFLGKIFGPLGFAKALLTGSLPLNFGWILLTNDLIWWVPFFLILKSAYRFYSQEPDIDVNMENTLASLLKSARTQTGESLWDLSHQTPVLLVALRHLGCTFCREMVRDVHERRSSLPARYQIVFLHSADESLAAPFFQRFGHIDMLRISDTERRLYRVLGLRRGQFQQVFGFKVWLRGFEAGLLKGLGVGPLQGDGFQMPGAFLIESGLVIKTYHASSASDRLPLSTICSWSS